MVIGNMLISVYIEGKKYLVEDSKNILEICLSRGFNIPYFCWHPALGSIGACRQCAVKQYNKNIKNVTSGRIVMSCMTPVSDGMCIFITDREVQEFRKSILELLMINHPHDCPVCEEGGNCHLQDMTVMAGQTYRRYRFSKRTHYNQYLGPFIKHEMNRCITCYRCVRFYQDYAGGNDLGVFGIHDNIYFGRITEGILQSEFSGNLIEVCPTGVFTDKTQSKNYSRKWDVLFAPSICQQCSIGCNIIIGERYGKLCRVENRYNGNINGYFLCDRGRFGCDYVNSDNRLKCPIRKRNSNNNDDYNNNSWVAIDQKQAVQDAACALKRNQKIIGIGSSRASLESNFALRKLVGSDNFYIGINRGEQERLFLIFDILCNSSIYVPSLREIEDYDAILILGEDITQTGARAALSVRQAINTGKIRKKNLEETQGIFEWQSAAVMDIVQDCKSPLLITGTDRTKLDDIAILTYYDSVQNQARFGFAIAHALDETAPEVTDFDMALNEKLNMTVQILMKARKPLIISGSNSGSKELIAAAANIARALKNRGSEVGITFIVSDVNSMGLVMMDIKKSLDDAFIDINSSDSNATSISAIILENNLYRHAGVTQVNQFLDKISYLIVLDHQHNPVQEKADLILSAANFVESDGTVINYEGRAQRFVRLYNPQYYDDHVFILESWRWLYLIYDVYIGEIRKNDLHIDYVINDIVDCFPKLVGIKSTIQNASFRIHGQKIARASHRYSGRTVMQANINVHEPCVAQDNETMFAFSMEGSHGLQYPQQQVAFAWVPGWNSPQAWNRFQDEIGGHLRYGDPGILLLKRNNNSIWNWFSVIPESFKITDDCNKWLITPCWHLFGSEEMSQKSECIQECMPASYIMFNILDAKKLNMQKNMLVTFKCIDQIVSLPIRLSVNLPLGHIGLPIGFPDIPVFLSGQYARDIRGNDCD